jgi:hypothetical protein
MKLYEYSNEIQRIKITFNVMAKSKKIAAELIAKELVKVLPKNFDFNIYMKECIERRKNLISRLSNNELIEMYKNGMKGWSDYKELKDLVMHELSEYDENVVLSYDTM